MKKIIICGMLGSFGILIKGQTETWYVTSGTWIWQTGSTLRKNSCSGPQVTLTGNHPGVTVVIGACSGIQTTVVSVASSNITVGGLSIAPSANYRVTVALPTTATTNATMYIQNGAQIRNTTIDGNSTNILTVSITNGNLSITGSGTLGQVIVKNAQIHVPNGTLYMGTSSTQAGNLVIDAITVTAPVRKFIMKNLNISSNLNSKLNINARSGASTHYARDTFEILQNLDAKHNSPITLSSTNNIYTHWFLFSSSNNATYSNPHYSFNLARTTIKKENASITFNNGFTIDPPDSFLLLSGTMIINAPGQTIDALWSSSSIYGAENIRNGTILQIIDCNVYTKAGWSIAGTIQIDGGALYMGDDENDSIQLKNTGNIIINGGDLYCTGSANFWQGQVTINGPGTLNLGSDDYFTSNPIPPPPIPTLVIDAGANFTMNDGELRILKRSQPDNDIDVLIKNNSTNHIWNNGTIVIGDIIYRLRDTTFVIESYDALPSLTIDASDTLILNTKLSLQNTLTTDGQISATPPNKAVVEFVGASSSLLGGIQPLFDTVIIGSGASLSLGFFGIDYPLRIKEGFIVDGTFNYNNPGNTTVIFEGDANKIIKGSAQSVDFYNLYLMANSITDELIPEIDLNIYNNLKVKTGLFNNTNNKDVRLKSISTTETARLDTLFSGQSDYLGNLTVERFMGADSGWRMITCPLENTTLAQWSPDVQILCCCGGNFFEYDESVPGGLEQGYNQLCAGTTPLPPGKGFFLYKMENGVSITLDATNTPSKFNKTVDISYTTNVDQNTDGWNLIGNPYPAPIDWESPGISKPTGLDNAIYVWNDNLQDYASYVNGQYNNNGSRIIPSGQAFWVHTTASSQITFTENAKAYVDSPATFLTKTPSNYYANLYNAPPSIKIYTKRIKTPSQRNETVIYFDPSHTFNFDPCCDAYFLAGYNIYMATVLGGTYYAINGIPYADTTIPIYLQVLANDSHEIAIDWSYSIIPSSMCLYLHDAKTNISYNLLSGPFRDTINTTDTNRFSLVIGSPANMSFSNKCGIYDLWVNFYGTKQVTWKDPQGNILKTGTSTGSDTLYNISPGTYIVELLGPPCGSTSDTITILDQTPSATITPYNPACSYTQDGFLAITPYNFDNTNLQVKWKSATDSGGFMWIPSKISDTIWNLSPGTYVITIQDTQCLYIDTINLNALYNPVILALNASDTLIKNPQSNCITLWANYINATSILWYSDTGIIGYSDTVNYCIPITLPADTITFTAIAADGPCSDTAKINVYISLITSELFKPLQSSLNPIKIKITTSDGKEIIFNNRQKMLSYIKRLPPGIYLITEIYENNLEHKKVIKIDESK